jgi:hypothetical protein
MEDATRSRIEPGTSARRQTVPARRPAVHDGYRSVTSWSSTAFGFPPSGRVPASRAANPSRMMKKYESEYSGCQTALRRIADSSRAE